MTAATFTPRRYSHVVSAVLPLRYLGETSPESPRPRVQVAMDEVKAWAFGGLDVRTMGGLCHVGSIGLPGSYTAVQVDVEFDAASDADALARFETLFADDLLANLVVGGRVARWVEDAAHPGVRRQETLQRVESPKTLD